MTATTRSRKKDEIEQFPLVELDRNLDKYKPYKDTEVRTSKIKAKTVLMNLIHLKRPKNTV